ncbi:MAG: restriction endonuclease subunit S [Phormidesmis sp.]
MIEGQENLLDLPINWAWSNLPLLAAIKPNALKAGPFGSALKKSFYVESGYKIYGQEQVISGNPFLGDYYVNAEKFESLKTCVVEPGDILVSLVGTIGKILILPEGIEPGIINPRLVKLSLEQKAAKSLYIKIYLESSTAKNYFSMFSHGGTMEILNLKILKALPLPLPPLNEQHRIVTKIETLTARSRKAREALDTIPALLDQFRQSVLAAAFRGDLTADWREQNPDVEPAEKLLERIREERLSRWEENCESAKENNLRKPKAQKTNSETIELTELPEIPQSWCWERLVNIADLRGGVTKGRRFKDKKTIQASYLRVANVQDGYLDLEEIKEIKVLPEDLDKYRLEHGDVLFTEGGDRDKLGRGTVWHNEVGECIHQNHVYRARLSGLYMLPEYISLAAKTEYSKNYFFRNASQTVNLASINITTLGKLPVPIPSFLEQKEICKQVRKAFATIDNLRHFHQASVEDTNQLDQSILAKAFRGELVPQDPTDEPATVLLQRIQAEREALKAKSKDKGKSSAKKKK